jgi:hypothetical protein
VHHAQVWEKNSKHILRLHSSSWQREGRKLTGLCSCLLAKNIPARICVLSCILDIAHIWTLIFPELKMELISRNITLGGRRVEIFADLHYKHTPKNNPYTSILIAKVQSRSQVIVMRLVAKINPFRHLTR